MLRVPGTNQDSLLKAKARGADVRMIYSVDDALLIAQQHPYKEVVFFAIGFETTTPPTAYAIRFAKENKLKNFTVFCNHVLTPIAMESILQHNHLDKDQLRSMDLSVLHMSALLLVANHMKPLGKNIKNPS